MTKPGHPHRRRFLLFASAVLPPFAWADALAQRQITILFICEHGYAKSLVAARHFERLAQARGMHVLAQSRGADPGMEVPPATVAGLAADGFSLSGFTPSLAIAAEIQSADYVVLISVSVDLGGRTGPVLRWDDVSPLSENYARARDELIMHDNALLDRIQADERQQP